MLLPALRPNLTNDSFLFINLNSDAITHQSLLLWLETTNPDNPQLQNTLLKAAEGSSLVINTEQTPHSVRNLGAKPATFGHEVTCQYKATFN